MCQKSLGIVESMLAGNGFDLDLVDARATEQASESSWSGDLVPRVEGLGRGSVTAHGQPSQNRLIRWLEQSRTPGGDGPVFLRDSTSRHISAVKASTSEAKKTPKTQITASTEAVRQARSPGVA